MKHNSKYNTAKLSSNTKIGYWHSLSQTERENALKVLEIAKKQEEEKKKQRGF